ncbi:MAG: hypothetical protein A3F11_04370 [Gammaproteobacteria bacterium RIFCSPHIGHO2_12_FULL_37_14]|nr:MAG: hypothetical protein A3F11_04370 [Gammaproteobacteria bacterium RIFCSPHIGHO2_12_FULL_37_14]
MKCTNVDVIEVKVLNDYKLHLTFDDGISGDVDISKLVSFKGVFEQLKDRKFFSEVRVNHDIGTICWGNGADLSPTLLHESIQRS